MSTSDVKLRAKARQHALADLGRLYRSEYQRLYRKHLKALGRTTPRALPAPKIETECEHPRADWNVQAYGTWCGLCNARVR